jgi:hypothetical protein
LLSEFARSVRRELRLPQQSQSIREARLHGAEGDLERFSDFDELETLEIVHAHDDAAGGRETLDSVRQVVESRVRLVGRRIGEIIGGILMQQSVPAIGGRCANGLPRGNAPGPRAEKARIIESTELASDREEDDLENVVGSVGLSGYPADVGRDWILHGAKDVVERCAIAELCLDDAEGQLIVRH